MLAALILLFAVSLDPLPIASLNHATPVKFEAEILPFLKESCLACHNQTKAKADLILETPQAILKGGESGPAVVPGNPEESLLLKVASHQEKPFMPPADNKVNAPNLTPDQLALLKLWIAQGAAGEVHSEQSISWRALSTRVRPILSLAVTDDAQFAACGRGNELFVYQLPTRRTIGPLTDSASGGSHSDLVQSLDFSPDGELLASGSYREVKLWRRQHNVKIPVTNLVALVGPVSAISPDGKKLTLATDDKSIRLVNADDQKLIAELKGDYRTSYRVSQLQRSLTRSATHAVYRKANVEKAEKDRQSQVERVRKASELVGAAQKSIAEQQNNLNTAKSDETTVQKEVAISQTKLKDAQDNVEKAQSELLKSKAAATNGLEAKLDELIAAAAKTALATNSFALLKTESEKTVQEKLKAAQKKITDLEAALKRTQLTNSAAENELHFAIAAAQTASDDLTAAQNNLQLAEADRKQNEMQLQAAQNAFTNAMSITRSLAFSSDGRILAAASENSVTLWSVDSGSPLDTITLPYTPSSITFSGDALITFHEDKVDAWQISPPWRLEQTITSANGQPAFADRVNTVRFSPDGQFLVTGGGEPSRTGEVKIWRVKDGQLVQDLKNLHSDTVLALAFSPDGRYLASGGADRFAKITEIASGRLVRVLEGHTHHVLSLSWKADGHTLITGGADNLIKVWDALTGEKKKGPEPSNKEVTAVTYIADTDQLLASSGDASLRLLKDNGEKVRTFEGAAGYLQAAAASPDGTMVFAGGEDGVFRIWRADTGKLLAEF